MDEEFYIVLIKTIFFNISTGYTFLKVKKRKINKRKEKIINNNKCINCYTIFNILYKI